MSKGTRPGPAAASAVEKPRQGLPFYHVESLIVGDVGGEGAVMVKVKVDLRL